MVGFGVEVGVGVLVGVGGVVGVGVGVGVDATGQVVWLSRKLNFSSGEVPTWPATWMVVFGLKFLTTILNTSEAPLLNVVNVGWNLMLTNPGLPDVLVQSTLYVPRLPVYTLPFAGVIRVKPSVPMAT